MTVSLSFKRLLPLALLGAAGCAVTPPDASPPPPPALAWQATLPHGGDAAALAGWWQRFDDPLLAALIDDAQADSPRLDQALARVRQARAALAGARGARWPAVNGTARAQRADDAATGLVATTQLAAGVDAQWEIDLFGGLRHGVAAAAAGAEQAALGWHDARVTLAAEVAQTYVGLRACEALVAVFEQEAASQSTSAGLTREKVRVGFEAPANGALADAAAAQTRDRLVAQQAECVVLVKALVLLTGSDEPALRERLAPRRALLPQPPAFAVPALPQALLAQRPDIAAAEQALVAAAAQVGVAEAARYPRLTLSGSVVAGVVRIAGHTDEARTWGFGPSLVLPLFDGGRLRAQEDAARGRYDEARATFAERLRVAVQEVEQALVRLDAAERREADARAAAQGFRTWFEAAESRWRIGAGSVIEMEDARRVALGAQAGLVGVQRERVAAWLALYRAAGGGWTADARIAAQ